MAALSASRFVCSASAEIVSTMLSISSERAARSRIAAVTSCVDAWTPVIAS